MFYASTSLGCLFLAIDDESSRFVQSLSPASVNDPARVVRVIQIFASPLVVKRLSPTSLGVIFAARSLSLPSFLLSLLPTSGITIAVSFSASLFPSYIAYCPIVVSVDRLPWFRLVSFAVVDGFWFMVRLFLVMYTRSNERARCLSPTHLPISFLDL